MRRSALALAVLTTAAALTLVGRGNISHAQYPSPVGSVSAIVDNPTPAPGTPTAVLAEVRDRSGAPVANEMAVFSITAQPGTDAVLMTTTVMTDASGRATVMLNPGSTPGVIVLHVQAGQSSSGVLVNVVAGISRQAPQSALPPAAPVEIRPPSTGDGGLAAD